MTIASFTISIFDDGILEADEEFVLMIVSAPIPFVDSREVFVTIFDDDGK